MPETKLLSPKELAKLRDEYIQDVAMNMDQFRVNCSGYWVRGIDASLQGWLAWEHNDRRLSEDEEAKAIAMWQQGVTLPKGWYSWSVDAAQRAFAIGCRLWGEAWYESADANKYDIVMQLALLGEVRYG